MHNLTIITSISILFSITANPSVSSIDISNHFPDKVYSYRQSPNTTINLTDMISLLKKTNPELIIKKGRNVNGRTLYYGNKNFKTVVQLYGIKDSLKQMKFLIIMDPKDEQTSLRIDNINNVISKIAEPKVQEWANKEIKNIQKNPEKNQQSQLRTTKLVAYEIKFEAKLKQLSFDIYQ